MKKMNKLLQESETARGLAAAIGDAETHDSTELRTNTRDLLEQAKFGGEVIQVTTFGKVMGVIFGLQQYNELRELLGMPPVEERVPNRKTPKS